jgi:hypothetical protein
MTTCYSLHPDAAPGSIEAAQGRLFEIVEAGKSMNDLGLVALQLVDGRDHKHPNIHPFGVSLVFHQIQIHGGPFNGLIAVVVNHLFRGVVNIYALHTFNPNPLCPIPVGHRPAGPVSNGLPTIHEAS